MKFCMRLGGCYLELFEQMGSPKFCQFYKWRAFKMVVTEQYNFLIFILMGELVGDLVGH